MLGSFDVLCKDFLGRIGRIQTKSGILETPCLLPVVDPFNEIISTPYLYSKMGFKGIITNAYLLKKKINDNNLDQIHNILDFEGIVWTDSGAYQILEYGKVNITPIEIIKFQELISTDIGVILDIPTGYTLNKKQAEWTVDETIKRADLSLKSITNDKILWVGPIQGGIHLDLLACSAKKMGSRNFPILALGSPTQIMEKYQYEILLDMLLTVKMNSPLNKPLHLFGAGHPMMFSLAVGCGYDTFDSASYALFAKEDRYLTEVGTLHLNELEYFPCICNVCNNYKPKEVRSLLKRERITLLAEHNLWVCSQELLRIKNAISEGRIWELIHQRSLAHPALFKAFLGLKKYNKDLLKYSPPVKRKGIFFFTKDDLIRPEILNYIKKIEKNYTRPKEAKTLILIPTPNEKPYHKILKKNDIPYQKNLSKHFCFYGIPFGIIPVELDETYPVSQTEIVKQESAEMLSEMISIICNYISKQNYNEIYFFVNKDSLWLEYSHMIKKIQERKKKQFVQKKCNGNIFSYLIKLF